MTFEMYQTRHYEGSSVITWHTPIHEWERIDGTRIYDTDTARFVTDRDSRLTEYDDWVRSRVDAGICPDCGIVIGGGGVSYQWRRHNELMHGRGRLDLTPVIDAMEQGLARRATAEPEHEVWDF